MQIPNYIKEAIKRNAKANATANETDNIVREWLNRNNIHNDTIIDQFIDCCSMSNNPDLFITFLENEASSYEGNEEH